MIADPSQFSIKFWGVRGSIPCPGTATVRYGGNTSCVEMQVGGVRLIFDGGTGLRLLGEAMMAEFPNEAHLFFTHSHWDHIQGFPFFTPAFIPGNCFHVYGVPSPNGATIEQRLHDQMLHPNFPVPLQIMQSSLQFYDLEVGEKIQIGDIVLQTGRLNHPGEAVGYRVDWQGRSAAYITDTEHFPDRLDKNVLQLAHKVNTLIIDATYTDDEYYSTEFNREGWGHSTWQEAIKVAKAAEVGQLILFHHDPSHCDRILDMIAQEAALAFPSSLVAREGLTLEVRKRT
jgi:phosphoribosyl 1,2-cyclic phosphodiesterase